MADSIKPTKPKHKKAKKKSAPRGKKPGLTKQVAATLVKHIQGGMTDKDACALAGISQQSLYYWLQRGKNKEAPVYTEFSESIEQARVSWKKASLERLFNYTTESQVVVEQEERYDAEGNLLGKTVRRKTLPKADQMKVLMWLLQVRFPDEFTAGSRLDVTSENVNKTVLDGEMRVISQQEQLKQLTSEELEVLLRVQEKLAMAGKPSETLN